MSQFASIVSIFHNLDLMDVRMFNFKVSSYSNLNANVYSYGLKVSFVSRCYDSDFKRRGKPQLVFMKRRIIKLSSWERNLI